MGTDADDLWFEIDFLKICSTCRALPPVYSVVKCLYSSVGEFYYIKSTIGISAYWRIKIAFSATVATHSVITIAKHRRDVHNSCVKLLWSNFGWIERVYMKHQTSCGSILGHINEIGSVFREWQDIFVIRQMLSVRWKVTRLVNIRQPNVWPENIRLSI